jgi:hypothetical protein
MIIFMIILMIIIILIIIDIAIVAEGWGRNTGRHQDMLRTRRIRNYSNCERTSSISKIFERTPLD